MIDFQRYVHGQDETQTAEPASTFGTRIRVGGTTNFSSVVDGIPTDSTQSIERGNSGELNPFLGTDSVFATARNKDGMPVYEVTGETLVTIGGVQGDVNSFVAMGILQKNKDGSFSEQGGQQQEQSKASQGDFLGLAIAPEEMATVNQAIEALPQESFDGIVASTAAFMAGRIDKTSVVRQFAQASGHSEEEASARLDKAVDVYQRQAGEALESFGVGETDFSGFHAWAQANRAGRFHETMQRQALSHDVSGYRSLAEDYMRSVPPTIDAFKRAGVPVRAQGGGYEVWMAGQWMSPGAAARAGLA